MDVVSWGPRIQLPLWSSLEIPDLEDFLPNEVLQRVLLKGASYGRLRAPGSLHGVLYGLGYRSI